MIYKLRAYFSCCSRSRLCQKWNFDELVASQRCRFYGSGNRRSVVANKRPDVRTEDNQSELAASQILLIANILIGGNQHIVGGIFRSFQQLPIFQLRRPVQLNDGSHFVRREEEAYSNGNVLIKQDAQRDGS